MHRKRLKISELKSSKRVGRISKNDVDLEPNEEDTIKFLARLGFSIECLKKNHIFFNSAPDHSGADYHY